MFQPPERVIAAPQFAATVFFIIVTNHRLTLLSVVGDGATLSLYCFSGYWIQRSLFFF